MGIEVSVKPYKGLNDIIASLPKEFKLDESNRTQSNLLERLDNRFRDLKVGTAVVEENYIDRHYLEDYCGYYGRCFYDYPRKCVRIHFFANAFQDIDYEKAVISSDDAVVSDTLGTYCGYIVVRPLPSALLGKVCVDRSYADQNARLLGKEIETHLSGHTYRVKTIAWQEQDHAISACATSSLWAAFHAIPGFNPWDVPSPNRITTNARKVLPEDGLVPQSDNKGLTVRQIINAIREEAFEPLSYRFVSMSYVKALVRAYQNVGLPIVLGITLYYRSDLQSKGAASRLLGSHAVTIVGYGEGDELKAFQRPASSVWKADDSSLRLQSSLIDRLYVHDDQIGPYSQMDIPDEYARSLSTLWGEGFDHDPVDAKVEMMVIPSHPKIRISFTVVFQLLRKLNTFLVPDYSDMKMSIYWDLRLETVCSLKEQIRRTPNIEDNLKFRLLTKSFPRYVWVIEMMYGREGGNIGKATKSMSLYFDATDMETSDFLIAAVHYEKTGYDLHRAIGTQMTPEEFLSLPKVIRNIVRRYKDNSDGRLMYPAQFH